MDQSLNTLIVDSDIERRMRLKQATTSVSTFRTTQQFSSPSEVLSKYEYGNTIDIAFLSARFSKETIKEFIAAAKTKAYFSDAAFVLVTDGNAAEQKSALPDFLLLGIDGFLMEPYSVDRLIETARLAARVKVDRAAQRKKAAVEILILDISNALSAASGFRAAGMASQRIEEKLHKLGETLHSLDDEGKRYFRDRMIDLWSVMDKPLSVVDLPKYQGASQRVKKIFEEKVLKQLEEMKDKMKV